MNNPGPRRRLPSTIPNRRSGATTRVPAAAVKNTRNAADNKCVHDRSLAPEGRYRYQRLFVISDRADHRQNILAALRGQLSGVGGLCRILPGGVVGRVSFRPWAYSRIWHAAVSLGASFLDPFTAVIFPGTPFGGGILGIFPAIGAGRFFAVVPDDRSGLLRFVDGQHYFPDVAFIILAFPKI